MEEIYCIKMETNVIIDVEEDTCNMRLGHLKTRDCPYKKTPACALTIIKEEQKSANKILLVS